METRLRENAAREVEFITVDKSYKPASTSWGVFERPADISAAFGGGRNLQPGAPLETEEAAATRLAGVRTAMQAFRKAQLLAPPAAPEPPAVDSAVEFPPEAVFFTRGARPAPLSAEALAAAPPAPPPRPRPAPCSHGHSHGAGHSHGHGHGHGEPGGGPGDEVDGAQWSDGEEGDGCEGEQHEDMNVRSAYLHVIGDLLQSLGVALAGGLIWWKPSLRALDPILTFTFSVVVLATTGKLLRDIVDIVMERCPRDVDAAQLASELAGLPGVASVHDLHIWALVPGKTVLTVHVEHGPDVTARQVLVQAQRLMSRHGIQHSTIQVEPAHTP